MTKLAAAPDAAPETALGLIDPDGRLVEADDALVGLNGRAGGAVGEPLAIPQLATLARQSRRLGVAIARTVVVADRDADVELFARLRPEGAGVRLSLSGWRERAPWRPGATGDGAELDLLRTGTDWRWECDATLRLGAVSVDAGARHGFDAAAMLGRPLTELFAFEADGAGQLRILDALAARRSFDAQPARLRPSGRPVLVSGLARHGLGGGFAGFAGGVRAGLAPVDPTVGATIGDHLERALRGPLGRIIADADSIYDQADGALGADYAGYAADIASAGRHLMALVDDLADLEAVERPDFRPLIEPVDLADLARRAAGLLSVRAANAGVAISRPAPDAVEPALGDFRRVLQILVNLIGNAVRYSPPGASVAVAVRPGAITVADAGKGIAPADQARVFEKFERVDPSEPGGSGLGLYIARRLARAMGGDVLLDSEAGTGARFTLTLPTGG